MPERVTGLQLTVAPDGAPIYVCTAARITNIRIYQFHNDMDIFCLFRECI